MDEMVLCFLTPRRRRLAPINTDKTRAATHAKRTEVHVAGVGRGEVRREAAGLAEPLLHALEEHGTGVRVGAEDDDGQVQKLTKAGHVLSRGVGLGWVGGFGVGGVV